MKKNKKPILSIDEVQIEINKKMREMYEYLETSRTCFRLQVNYGAAEGFEFKSVVSSNRQDEGRMQVSHYYVGTAFETNFSKIPLFKDISKEIIETGFKNEDGWTQAYVAFDNIEKLSVDYSSETGDVK